MLLTERRPVEGVPLSVRGAAPLTLIIVIINLPSLHDVLVMGRRGVNSYDDDITLCKKTTGPGHKLPHQELHHHHLAKVRILVSFSFLTTHVVLHDRQNLISTLCVWV